MLRASQSKTKTNKKKSTPWILGKVGDNRSSQAPPCYSAPIHLAPAVSIVVAT
jgi:hypothetical protein